MMFKSLSFRLKTNGLHNSNHNLKCQFIQILEGDSESCKSFHAIAYYVQLFCCYGYLRVFDIEVLYFIWVDILATATMTTFLGPGYAQDWCTLIIFNFMCIGKF